MPLQCNGFEVVAFAWVSLLKKVQTFDEMESTHRATANWHRLTNEQCELVLLAQPNSGGQPSNCPKFSYQHSIHKALCANCLVNLSAAIPTSLLIAY